MLHYYAGLSHWTWLWNWFLSSEKINSWRYCHVKYALWTSLTETWCFHGPGLKQRAEGIMPSVKMLGRRRAKSSPGNERRVPHAVTGGRGRLGSRHGAKATQVRSSALSILHRVLSKSISSMLCSLRPTKRPTETLTNTHESKALVPGPFVVSTPLWLKTRRHLNQSLIHRETQKGKGEGEIASIGNLLQA